MSNWEKQLDELGYAIIPNIFSIEECNKYISRIWTWLESLDTGIQRNDPKTWTNDKWPDNLNGIMHGVRVGHTQFVWDIRMDERIIKIFETIWNTSKLLVSFDGICIMRPPELVGPVYFRDNPGIHTDQAATKKSKCCIQSFINLEETTNGDGCLIVYPRSHLVHQEVFAVSNNQNWNYDYYSLGDKEYEWLKANDLKPVSVLAPKGSLVLWDSRTLHNAKPPQLNRAVPGWRFTVYLCYTPANLADRNELNKKRKAFNELRTTAHWPHKIKIFRKSRRERIFKYQKDLPILSDRGKELAGFIDIY